MNDNVLEIAAVIWFLFHSILCVLSGVCMYVSRKGPPFIKRGVVLIFLYGLLNLILTIVVMLPTAYELSFILFLLTGICYYLNLAVFWIFAFKYWMTSLASRLLMQQKMQELQTLQKYKKVQKIYMVTCAIVILVWTIIDYT